MKLSKRLIAVLLIVVMVLSVFAMAACEPDLPNNDDNGQNNNGNNNGNNGNNNGDNNGNNGNNGEGSAVSDIVNALAKEGIKPLEFNMTWTTNEEDDTYVRSADGSVYSNSETGFDGHSNSSKYNQVLIIKALADLAKGKMDVVKKETSVGEDHSYPDSSDEESDHYYYSGAEVEYFFLRNWHGFDYSTFNRSDDKDNPAVLEEVTDWSDVALEYRGSNIEDSYLSMLINYVDYAQRVNVIILNLADAANAVTVDGNKVVVDLNKLAYNMFNDINSALPKITNNTTIGQLLNDPTIKKYLSSILNAFTVDEVLEILDDFGLLDNEIAEQLLAVKPDENSTTYDYIVKLISSDEANELVSDMLKEMLGISLPANISDVKLGFILGLVANATGLPDGTDLLALAKTYVKMVADFVTETQIKVTSSHDLDGYQGDTSQTSTIKNAKMEYVLNSDKTIASQTLTLDYEESGAHSFSRLADDLYSIGVGTSKQHLEASVVYKDSVAFTDIDECAVEYYTQEFVDGEYDESFEYWFNTNEYSLQEGFVGNLHYEIEDGILTEMVITDESGATLWELSYPIKLGNGYDGAMISDYFDVTLMVYDYSTDTEHEVTFNVMVNGAMNMHIMHLEFSCENYYIGTLYVDAPTTHYANTVSGVLNGEDWTKTVVEE